MGPTMADEGQVVIPDLDDAWMGEPEIAMPPPPMQSPGSMSNGRASPQRPPTGDALRHGAALDYFASPPRASDRTPGTPFSFPVKKPSFASLRAAIKREPTTPSAEPNVSPFFDEPRKPRPYDISAASGLAQVTGMGKSGRWHAKSGSQASAADADVSLGVASTRSPSRASRARHAHHGSHYSEYSMEGVSMSPNSSRGVPPVPGDDTLWSQYDAPYDETRDESVSDFGELPWVRRGALLDALPRHSEPRTPLEFALEQVLRRFAAAADEAWMAVVMTATDVDMAQALFPTRSQSSDFDAILDALGHVAKHNSAMVIDSLLQWRQSAMDAPTPRLRRRPSDATVSGVATSGDEALQRRKVLATTYLVCRALRKAVPERAIADPESACSDAYLTTLFQLLHLCSIDRENERGSLPQLHATLQQQCFDTVARLLGALSLVRLPAIGDQFIQILRQSSAVSASRDHELLTEAAILGMRYLRITVYPMEQFEEGAELVASLVQFFAHSHGYRIKRAFARVLCAMLLPVARTASAELHHPIWQGAVSMLLPKTQAMAARARYWSVAQPLWTAALCSAPPEVLLAQWTPCLDVGNARLKDRSARPIVLLCATQLLHAYLFHCHEGTNATTRRLDAFFAQYLPAQRGGIAPSDAHLEPYIAMVHYTLFRQPEYAQSVVLDMLRHSVFQDRSVVHQPELLQPTRMRIALRAIARTLQCYASGDAPPFPTGDEGALLPDVPLGDEPATPIAFPSAAAGAPYGTFAELIGQIALIADYQVKDVTVFDERVAIARGSTLPSMPSDRSALDREQYVVRTHVAGAFTVVYAREQQAYLDLLRTCFEVWPRCLSPSLAMPTVLAMLFRAQYSAEPALQKASAAALLRIARQCAGGALGVVQAYMRWAFRQDGFVWELVAHAEMLLPKMTQTVRLFIDLLDVWWTQRRYEQASNGHYAEDTLDEIEACAVYLLCAPSAALRQQAVTVLRLVAVLHDESTARPLPPKPRRTMHLLEQPRSAFLAADNTELSASQRARVARWHSEPSQEPLSALATASDAMSQSLWIHALPAMIEAFAEKMPVSATAFYTYVLARVKAMDARLGTKTRSAPTSLAKVCWRSYTAALCAATALDTPDVPRADVVPLLVPYLASDEHDLRDAAAYALGYTQGPVYVPLLAALHAAARPVHEETRLTPARVQTARVVYHTAPRMPRVADDARVARLVGAWVQDTLTFLQGRAGLPTAELCALKRYFAATVGHFYTALGAAAPEYMPTPMHVELFGMLYDWHSMQGASRLAAELSAAAEQCVDARQKERVIVMQRHELHLLATHAEQAMAALCAAALPDAPNTPLALPTLLAWIRTLLQSTESHGPQTGRAALRALLEHNGANTALLEAVLVYAFKDLAVRSAPRTFVDVLAETYCATPLHLAPGAAMAVGLVHLAHADVVVRAHAVAMLEVTASRWDTPAYLAQYAVRATSAQPSAYLAAQQAISVCLAHAWPAQRAAVVAELVRHIDHLPLEAHDAVLSVLPPWVEEIAQFAPRQRVPLDDEPHAVLTRLAALTFTHGTAHPLQVRVLWTSVLGHSADSGAVLASFVVHLALVFGSVESVVLAQQVVACIDARIVRAAVFAHLCEQLRPDAIPMLSVHGEVGRFASLATRMQPADGPALSAPLVAILLMSECVSADERAMIHHLPMLLHGLCVQIASMPESLRDTFASAAEQMLRGIAAAAAGSNEHSDSPLVSDAIVPAAPTPFATALAAVHASLRAGMPGDDAANMRALVDGLCALGLPLLPTLREAWAAEALQWATAAPVSPSACRSLEVLRTLRPPLHDAMLAELLARLGGTAAHAQADHEAYAQEVLLTLHATLCDAGELSDETLGALYWAASAAASTPIEDEFACTVRLLQTLLGRMEGRPLDGLAPPPGYDVAPGLQRILLRGLRSATLCDATFSLLVRLTSFPLPYLDESFDTRAAVLLAASLPWCMQACDMRAGSLRHADARAVDPAEIVALGEGLAAAADAAQRPDLARVAHSIARARFRSTDELARQAASCLASFCAADESLGATLVLILLHMLFCEREWVCRQTLVALAAVLGALRAQNADGGVRALGARMLDPLLALLATPLAPLALDVLDAPALARDANDPRDGDKLFGTPSPSGWGIAEWRQDALRTRHNLQSVSRAFGAAQHAAAAWEEDEAEELGALASQLDDLASYFGQSDEEVEAPQTEDVAKILARSTYRTRDSVLFAAAPPPLDAVLSDMYPDVIEEESVLDYMPSTPPRTRASESSLSDGLRDE